MGMISRRETALVALAALVACYGDVRTTPDTVKAAADVATQQPELAGTSWRLVKIESMADSTFTPSDPSRYTIAFGSDGRASLRLDCNRGSANWTSEAKGHLTFGQAAMTRAMCPPESLSSRFARDLEYFRTYVLRDGRLHLATMADGAIYEFEPLTR
jgi:para-nitrobenzyl esterase